MEVDAAADRGAGRAIVSLMGNALAGRIKKALGAHVRRSALSLMLE